MNLLEQDRKKQETDESWQILESIINPRIQLNPWLDKLIDTIASQRTAQGQSEMVGQGIPMIRILARIPDFVQHPRLYLSEVDWRYPRLKADCETVRTRLAKMTELISSPEADPQSMKMYAHCQTAYGLALSMATILNSILRAFDQRGISLAEDSAGFVHEIITLAGRASRFRPLAASYIPVCLATGWAATDDLSRQAEMEGYLAEYQTDLADAQWLEGAIWLKARYGSWRRKPLTPLPNNPVDICGADSNAITRQEKAAMHGEGSCGVQ